MQAIRIKYLILAMLFMSLVGCTSHSAPDLIVYNATVITIDKQHPEVSAFAVLDGNFIATGGDAEILALASDSTQLLDAKGKTLMPGFNDAHLHSVMVPPSSIPLWDINSIDDLVHRLQQEVRNNPDEKSWLIAMGYDDVTLGRHLTRRDLDRVSTTRPIFVVHASLHLYAVNSLAISNAAFPSSPFNPDGGKIYRNQQGEATGLLSERTTWPLLFNDKQPSPFVSGLSSALGALELFYRRAHSLGITSFSDAMVPKELALAYWMSDPEDQGIRVNLLLDGEDLSGANWLNRFDGFSSLFGFSPFSNSWLRAKSIKVFHGMSLSGRTTKQYEHYHGRPDYFGDEPQRNQEELNQLVADIHAMGFQAAIHSNGDFEIDMALNAIAHASKNDTRDHRHRLEHASIVNDEILQRMKEQNVVMAPHSYIYEKGPMIEAYGEKLWPRMFANASSFQYGIPNAANSDYPVSGLSPLLRIQSLVTRTSRKGKTYGANQVLTVAQALHAYTMGGAYASFEENRKGSITPGKFADFVVLSQDPRKVNVMSIKDIDVQATYVAGIRRFTM